MPGEAPRARGPTRHELLSRGLAIGVITLPALAGAGDAWARAQSQGEVLSRVLRVEQIASFSYRHVLGSAALAPSDGAAVRDLATQDDAHAAPLTSALSRLGEPPPTPPADVQAADRALRTLPISGRLAGLRSRPQARELLLELEEVAVGACYTAVAELRDPQLVQTVAQVMANHAQHATALRRLRHGRDLAGSVPYAFVVGRH